MLPTPTTPPAAVSQEYRVIPAPLYYRNIQTDQISAVYGGLADYYGFYDVQAFTGTDRQDAAQLAEPANWKEIGDYHYLELHQGHQPQIFALRAGTTDQVDYLTEQFPGPFRIPGHVPFTATDEPSQYETLSELAAEMQQQGAQYSGRIVERGPRRTWVAFEEEMGGSGECPWERVSLDLGPMPLDTYAYVSGRRATAQEGEGNGRVTLWQQSNGQYFVETDPLFHHAPHYPTLEPLTLAQVQQQYHFDFTPNGQQPAAATTHF